MTAPADPGARLFVTIILDGVGVGDAPDAEAYGDAGANTLASVCRSAKPALPNLAALGLGRLADAVGLVPLDNPKASFGSMEEASAGKDSTTGHWELAGVLLDRAFPTYPDGFPDDVIETFLTQTGSEGILANKPASGTDVIEEFGDEHRATGHPIVYTSADSVFQIAAHTETIPLPDLYRLCRIAREEVCVGRHAVGRVIARPFRGESGALERVSEARRDYSLKPTGTTVQQSLQEAGIRTVAIGKIGDLFADVGFAEIIKTKTNAEGIEQTLAAIRDASSDTFIWTNLVDFDQLYGHRNDPSGFARALEAFDRALPELIDALPTGARLLITADHGNDPCFPGTDHTRERVPVLLLTRDGENGRDLGTRPSFADHAATVAAHFDVELPGPGTAMI